MLTRISIITVYCKESNFWFSIILQMQAVLIHLEANDYDQFYYV